VSLSAVQLRVLKEIVAAYDHADAVELSVWGKPLVHGISLSNWKPRTVVVLAREGMLAVERHKRTASVKRHGWVYTQHYVEFTGAPTAAGRRAARGA